MTGALLQSGAVGLQAPVNDVVIVAEKHYSDYDLATDAPVNVDFGGVAVANVVDVTCSRPITVQLTGPAGTNQAITVDGWLRLGAKTSGYTAISLTRTPAVETTVRVFVAQKS